MHLFICIPAVKLQLQKKTSINTKAYFDHFYFAIIKLYLLFLAETELK